MVPELSDDFSFKIKKRRKQNYQWASDDAMSDVKVQLHSVQEKETGRVVPKGLCVLLMQSCFQDHILEFSVKITAIIFALGPSDARRRLGLISYIFFMV